MRSAAGETTKSRIDDPALLLSDREPSKRRDINFTSIVGINNNSAFVGSADVTILVRMIQLAQLQLPEC